MCVRAHAWAKAGRGVMDPRNVLSIACDGTQQLPNGIPQVAHKMHGDENANNRLSHHMSLAHVHGEGTWCYVTRDNIHSDPNLTIETLQRTLQAVEDSRGELPPLLYLQMDNCYRENKNVSLLNWCVSLVERTLFPAGIEIGFLPVGHTHNEVDQIASRISVALRHRDVTTPLQLCALLRECYPDMAVEILDHVADTKSFLNPGLKDSWTDSRFKRHQNLTAFRHFRIVKAANGDVHIHHKVSCEGYWSHPQCPIKGQGPEPSKAVGKLRPQAEVYGLSSYKSITEEKRAEVRKSLDVMKRRIPAEDFKVCEEVFDYVFTDRPGVKFHWKNGGVFATEGIYQRRREGEVVGWAGRNPEDEEEIDFIPSRGLFQHYNQVAAHMVTPDPDTLCVGQYVVCVLTDPGTKQVRSAPRPDAGNLGFQMGEIIAVNSKAQQISVVWWSTVNTTVSKATHVWRVWMGPHGQPCAGIVTVDEVVYTFRKLTTAGRMWVAEYRTIQYILECRAKQKQVEMVRIQTLAEMAHVQQADDYLDDVVAELDAGAHQMQELKKYDALMQQEVVVTEVQSSSEMQGKTHVEDEDTELDCEGYAECECDYDAVLTSIVPGHSRFSSIYAHNWRRIVEKAEQDGQTWINNSNSITYTDNRAREWARMEACGIDSRPRQARQERVAEAEEKQQEVAQAKQKKKNTKKQPKKKPPKG